METAAGGVMLELVLKLSDSGSGIIPAIVLPFYSDGMCLTDR